MDKHIFTNISLDELSQTIKEIIQEALNQNSTNTSQKENDEELLSIEDVQEIFRVSKVTIHKWKKLGLIPYYKVNRSLYFKKSEIVDSLQSKKRKFSAK